MDGTLSPAPLTADALAKPWIFPFFKRPAVSWHEGPRRFGAARAGGRLHAGCDLYAAAGTGIRAVADGVVRRFAPFYAGTWALEVDHGRYTVRYGEVQSTLPGGVAVGGAVQAGQVIARVGHLVGVSVPSDMLHLELYDDRVEGALSQPGNPPYQRRADLLDPTGFLDRAV